MLPSRDIGDYVEASLADLRPDVPLPVNLHLYFAQNRHIVLWRKRGEAMTPLFLQKYRKRGMDQVWVHRDDLEEWKKYLSTDRHGHGIPRLLLDPDLGERQRIALVAKEARLLLGTCDPRQASARVGEVLDAVSESADPESRRVTEELWKLSRIDPEIEHGVRVAAYSVLFALAFGRIERELICQVALAALLHDIGLTQVPASLVAAPARGRTASERRRHAHHVEAGLELINAYAPAIPDRIKTMPLQHHEKFDGSGLPEGTLGFRGDDVSQLLALADLLVSMAMGQWDGKKRTIQQAIETLCALERARRAPECFNPEVLAAVRRWMSGVGAPTSEPGNARGEGREAASASA